MPLETVANYIDDATHADLDRQVLKTARSDPSLHEDLAAFLLMMILVTTRELDPKYMQSPLDAVALLKEHPQLTTKLHDSWTIKSFKGIRNLSAVSLSRHRVFS